MRRTASAAIGIAMILGACSPADTAAPSTEPTTGTVDQSTTLAATTTTVATTATVGATTAVSVTTTAVPTATTTSTTATPTSTTLPDVWWLADDLFCRDLYALGYAYPEAALYWSTFDTPDRMDADRNGMPCETVYPQADVVAFWGQSATLGTTMITVVSAWVQNWYDGAFVRDDMPDEITGPLQVQCSDSWPVEVGDVFVCRGIPQTEHPNSLETASLLILVLDPSGKAIWSAGTSGPDDTAGLRYAYHVAPKGLSCDDLIDQSVNAGPFSRYASPPDDAFFYSMVYWSLEGRPSYMDPDGNGIPCEDLYDAERIERILEGGPVPLYVRDVSS